MDELLHRVMPHSLEAEQAVLGAMFLDAQRIPDVIRVLQLSDFYQESRCGSRTGSDCAACRARCQEE